MKKKRQSDMVKRNLTVYYARAMDGVESSKILQDECLVKSALNSKGLFIANPYSEQKFQMEQVDHLVQNNLKLLKNSDVLLANLSLQSYTYIGAVFEILQAANLGIPIVACIGNSNLGSRYYLHYYCSFICSTIDEAVEYMWRCWTSEGVNQQLKEEMEFYDKIAAQVGEVTRKQYKSKKLDIGRYERERNRLKEKLRDYCHEKNALELGCGTGEWTQVMTEVAKSVTCIESSQNMITRAKERLEKSPIQPFFINGDFFDDTLSIEPCDVVVSYFTLSFLPPLVQNTLLSVMKKWASKDGHFLFGESIQISTLPSIGLGLQRMQTRKVRGKEYVIYKEHFTPVRLQKLLNANGFRIIDSPDDVKWFTFCATKL